MGNLIKKTTTKIKFKDLNETNLTKKEKELLVSIYSDSESFKPNQTIYKKRLDVDIRTIQRLCKSLTEKGYLQIKQLTGYNNYQWVVSNKPTLLPDDETSIETQQIEKIIPTVTVPPQVKEEINIENLITQIDNIITNTFPSISEDVLNIYINNVLDAVENCKVKNEDLTDAKLIKSISKYHTEPEPTKLTIKDLEIIVNNKMNVGTKNQRDCTINKMKDWFIKNGCTPTEEEIKSQTFRIHNESKTTGRVLDQRYQD